jgi:multiple sugar transport system ATP-binding protein
VEAVKDFNLTIADREFVVFVGPSGCGKSTTLRMVAGLERITSGKIYIGDTLVNNVAAKDRDISMVFQNYALYPHMTVYDNIAFPLKMRKYPKSEIKKKVNEAAQILEISELLKRKPKALSGGQRQRVAIGRAIVREPKVFLMDEPLSNLDAKLRNQMRSELMKLRRRIDTTFIYVTHDQTEAMTLGDRIVIMNDGVIMQIGTPAEVFNRPENIFVAGFIGTPQMNFIDGELLKKESGYAVSFNGNEIDLDGKTSERLEANGSKPGKVTIGIRPENLKLSDKGIAASADVAELTGSTMNLHAYIGETEIISQIPFKSDDYTPPRPGEVIHLTPESGKIHIFDSETGESLVYRPVH